MIHGGRQHERARAKPHAAAQADFPFSEILTARTDMPAGPGVFHDDGSVALLGILLDGDGVGAVRHRRASEDAHRLARTDTALEARTSRGFADQLQRCRERGHVGRAHRIAVHGRGIEGRLSQRRGKIGGKHPAMRLGNGDVLRLERRKALQDKRERIVDGKERHRGQGARK